LFLEFPNVTPDAHPLDLDAGNEFLFGPDLLVAPAPYPDQIDSYQVKFPSADWFDYWTGERVTSSSDKPLMIQPSLDALPVYVRGGSILPMQPLIQSTEEKPQGALVLRVYPGSDCKGSLYQDDGKSMAFKQGGFLRMQFTCEATGNVLKLHIGAHLGTYKPWWNQIRAEFYGSDAASVSATINGRVSPDLATIEPANHRVIANIPDTGEGMDVEITSRSPVGQ
jgi:alpha-glucosidase